MIKRRLTTLKRISLWIGDREGKEIMCIRRKLENLTGFTGCSGFGFPFSMRYYNFYLACLKSERNLSELARRITSRRSGEHQSSIIELVHKIALNSSIIETGGKLGSVNGMFQWVRKAFHLPEKGNISYEMPYTGSDARKHEKCNLIMEQLEVYLHSHMPMNINTAAKTIMERYRKRESMLFANRPDHNIPGTNNEMERFFRKTRSNIIK